MIAGEPRAKSGWPRYGLFDSQALRGLVTSGLV